MENVRDVIPYIFWPWFGISCFILLRRRVSHGSWRPQAPAETPVPIEFPPPPPPEPQHHEQPHHTLPEPSTLAYDVAPTGSEEPAPATDPPDEVAAEREPAGTPVTVMEPVDPDRPRSRSLAEAVDGIAMPCDLAPLMGTGAIDPREASFFTHGHAPASVGSALADELERLGYSITPLDDRSILAERGPDGVEARLMSTELVSAEVMREMHPSAPEGALVVQLKLT